MNDDYLWNKTGSDTEIERLEEKLSVLKSAHIKLPPLSQVSRDVRQPWFRPLAFGAVGLVATALLLMGLWVGLRPAKNDSKSLATIQELVSPPLLLTTPKAANQEVEKNHKNKKTTSPEYLRLVYRDSRSKLRSSNSTNIEPKRNRQTSVGNYSNRAAEKSPPRLTEDERNAYKQLMLALSITGSKLKLIKDKIDGTNNKQGDAKKL